jgi:hypothetical protein
MELNDFLKGFKEVKKKEKKDPVQMKFNLDLNLKKEVNNKLGYNIKELNKYKKFGDD